MEAQNHFYGHSAALAAYAGLTRPRHIAGLVQHGWTAGSPVDTHFRDFPTLRDDSPGRWPTGARRLLVWSHESRGWSPDPSVETVPIGAGVVGAAVGAVVGAGAVAGAAGVLVGGCVLDGAAARAGTTANAAARANVFMQFLHTLT